MKKLLTFSMLFLCVTAQAKNINTVGQDYSNASDGFVLGGGTTERKLTVTGADITVTGSGSNTYTYPTPGSGSAETLVGLASTQTMTNKTLTTPVIGTGLTASGSTANDFSGSTGTFLTSTGANTLGGAVTESDATTPSITTASGKTNTGYVQVNGKTSGALKLTAADAAAQTVTVNLAAQTTGAATLTIPDMAHVNKTVAWLESPSFTTPALGTPSSGTLSSCSGLPISGLTSSTSTALGVGSIELGNASDTTIARSGAGAITVEGAQVVLANTIGHSGLSGVVASDFGTTSLTLVDVTGLSVTVPASQTWSFRMCGSAVSSSGTAGAKFAITGAHISALNAVWVTGASAFNYDHTTTSTGLTGAVVTGNNINTYLSCDFTVTMDGTGGTVSVQVLKVTSQTITVQQGTYLIGWRTA